MASKAENMGGDRYDEEDQKSSGLIGPAGWSQNLGHHCLIVNEVKPTLNRNKVETARLVLGGKRSQMLLPFIIQLAKRIFAVLL